jgi:hypothetical protein
LEFRLEAARGGRVTASLVGAASLAMVLLGCSSSGASGPGAGAGGAPDGDAAGGTGGTGGSGVPSCGASQSCPAPGYETTEEPRVVESLFARVVDLDGNPVVTRATVCDKIVCIKGETDSNGVVVTCDRNRICIPGIQPAIDMTRPAFTYGTGLEYAEFAFSLPSGPTSFDLGDMTAIKLPALGTGMPLSCGAVASSGGLTLRLDPDVKVTIDTTVYTTPEEQQLRAISVPIDRAPSAVDPTLGFEIVIAATPMNATFCPPAALSVDNTAGFPAGTPVEVFVHGVDPMEPWAVYGGWTKASDGVVSADGAKVETTPEGGLPMLSVIGIRRRP